MTQEMNLGDIPVIPDLSSFAGGEEAAPFENGWYKAVIKERRTFVDNTGNERVFESSDEPAQRSGRNIRLQVEVTRQSDGRKMNISWLTNYNPSDLTQETIGAVLAKKEAGGDYGELFRPFMTLQRLSKLQTVAGVRQLQTNGNGGLDLHPLFGKECYIRVAEDDRDSRYKQIKDIRSINSKPKQVL